MHRRIDTSYGALLRKLAQDGLLDQAQNALVGRLFERGEHDALALATHQIVRRLVAQGQLALRRESADHSGAGLSLADERRGCLYTLPALFSSRRAVLRLPLNPLLGPPPSFSDQEVARLFQDQSRRFLSSIEQSADMKGVVTAMLDRLRRVLGVPASLLCTQALPIPEVVAKGLRHLREQLPDGGEAERARSADDFATSVVRGFNALVEAAGRDTAAFLYVPDLGLLPRDQRPLARGSALLIPLKERQPAWSAVLLAVSPETLAFDQERLARARLFAPHFRRQITHAVLLQTAMSHDYLTGAYNRAFFEDLMARTLAGVARRGQGFALLIADIDDFKEFNTRHGYDAGDEVLRGVAAALTATLRTTDVLARYGGEEFVVLLSPPVTREEAVHVAERLRAAVERLEPDVPTLQPEGIGARTRVTVTISLGGAVYPEDGRTRDGLWGCANAQLLAAKREGKNLARLRAGLSELGRPDTGTNGP